MPKATKRKGHHLRSHSRRAAQATPYTLLHEMQASTTAPVPEAHRIDQLTRMWEGLAALETHPSPPADDWRVCSDAMNLMETLVECGPWMDCQGQLVDVLDSSGLLKEATEAMAGLIRAPQQQVPPADSLHCVRMVLIDYAEALGRLNERSMIRCHRMTAKRIFQVRQGKCELGDVVVGI